jgi:hypothetical protein
MESTEDLAVTWTVHGPQLAREVLAYAEHLERFGNPVHVVIADHLRALVKTETSMFPAARPQLTVPPRLRSAVPPRPMKPEVGS